MSQHRPKVVHLIYHLGTGGLERVMLNCIHAMPDFEHQVVSLTAADAFATQLPAGTSVYCLGKKPGADLSSHRNFWRYLRKHKPALVHSYNIATLEYQAISMLAGVKARLHAEHGRDIFDPTGANKKYQWLRRLISPFIHTFVSVSNDLHRWMQDTVRIPTHKTKLIYNGANTTLFKPAFKQHNQVEFIHVARLAKIKDQATLLQAAALLANKQPAGWSLTIVGDGPESANLHALQQQLHLSNVQFLGNRTDIPALLQNADCFVLSSIAEGIPMTILEAMASGLPIISTNVGGIPEIVDTSYGYLVPSQSAEALADAMQSALISGERLKQQGMLARDVAEKNFSESHMIDQYNRLYHHLLN